MMEIEALYTAIFYGEPGESVTKQLSCRHGLFGLAVITIIPSTKIYNRASILIIANMSQYVVISHLGWAGL